MIDEMFPFGLRVIRMKYDDQKSKLETQMSKAMDTLHKMTNGTIRRDPLRIHY